MSTHEDRKPAHPGEQKIDMATVQASFQAAIGETTRQRDQAHGRCVELATALAMAQARIKQLEATVGAAKEPAAS